MHRDELIARLEAAWFRLPSAFGGAICCVFLAAMPAVLAEQDTWQEVVAILALGFGLYQALLCCIAALRARNEGEGV